MPTAEFFSQFGIFAFRDFLGRDFCSDICDEILNSSKQPGSFRNLNTGEEVVDEQLKRRSEVTRPESDLKQRVEDKFQKLLPEIEKHYDLELEGVQSPKFCLYETGDYYRFHIDSGEFKNIGEYATPRKVSAIVFLNEESQVPMEGKYCGGNLTFYGLMQNEAFSKFGLPLVGEEGMLITFPPNLGHEVTEVTAGHRYTIATWFV